MFIFALMLEVAIRQIHTIAQKIHSQAHCFSDNEIVSFWYFLNYLIDRPQGVALWVSL